MKENIKKLIYRLKFRFSHQLPVGSKEFIDYCDSIFWAYDLPNMPSYHHAVATMIMNQSPTVDRLPPRLFAKSIKKAMANEVAYARLMELREEEKKARGPNESEGATEALVSETQG